LQERVPTIFFPHNLCKYGLAIIFWIRFGQTSLKWTASRYSVHVNHIKVHIFDSPKVIPSPKWCLLGLRLKCSGEDLMWFSILLKKTWGCATSIFKPRHYSFISQCFWILLFILKFSLWERRFCSNLFTFYIFL